jgi:hypothetical protein
VKVKRTTAIVGMAMRTKHLRGIMGPRRIEQLDATKTKVCMWNEII